MPTISGLPSLFLATAVALFGDPATSPTTVDTTEAVRATEMAADLEAATVEPSLEVISSSPLPAGHRVGSHFGYRISARTGRRTFHAGIDFLAERGTPVYAVRGGVVEAVARNTQHTNFAGYGNAVVIHHAEEGRWSFYAHLNDVNVEAGQVVEPGQLVGHVGNTTNGRFPGMGSHLHFEVRVAAHDGSSPFPGAYRRHNVDPEEWLAELGVRFEHEEHDCAMHAEGELDETAPVLTVRPIDGAPVMVASNAEATATF